MIIVNDTMNDLANDGTYVVSIDDKLYVKLLQRIQVETKLAGVLITVHGRP